MIKIYKENPLIRLVASANTWIEGDALIQLERTAERKGITASLGLPDIHPGKGSPVGSAFLSESLFYPHIIGNDAGCGMGLFKTTLKTRKMKKDKWASALMDFDNQTPEPDSVLAEDSGLEPGPHDAALGTIGGGNHFAELQMADDVMDESAFHSLGCDTDTLFLLVHSGSRSLGEMIYRNHTGRFGADPLPETSLDAGEYLEDYHHAVKWAEVNRRLIAGRFMDTVGGECEQILDVCHNSITRKTLDGRDFWLHRKGAAPSDQGPVIIPGSRGALSYLVMPTGPQDRNLWSVAHGAGRKWNRGSCKGKLNNKWTAEQLKRTELGGIVICDDKELMFEEAPQAYKKIESVISAMTDCGMIKVIATFRPVITYKSMMK